MAITSYIEPIIINKNLIPWWYPILNLVIIPSYKLALRYFVWVIFVSNIDTLYSYTSILEPKTVG